MVPRQRKLQHFLVCSSKRETGVSTTLNHCMSEQRRSLLCAHKHVHLAMLSFCVSSRLSETLPLSHIYIFACENKSVFNWTFCQLLKWKTQLHKNTIKIDMTYFPTLSGKKCRREKWINSLRFQILLSLFKSLFAPIKISQSRAISDNQLLTRKSKKKIREK